MSNALRQKFLNPPYYYTPVPFWFINGDLSESRLRSQLEDFRAHGVYIMILSPRMGFDPSVPYLSETYFRWMTFIVQNMARLGMQVVFNDDAMYPSGAAGGLVVQENPDFAAKCIHMVEGPVCPPGKVIAHVAVVKTGDTAFRMHSNRLISPEHPLMPEETELWIVQCFSGGTIRGTQPDQDDNMPNAPLAADLLMPEAVSCFLRLTHDAYYTHLGQYFHNTISGFYTSQPNPLGRNALQGARPWTEGLEKDWFAQRRTLAELPMLWWDGGPSTEAVREDFEHMITVRLEKTYYFPMGRWCREHNVEISGHPLAADSIRLQRSFTIPGQDLVWRSVAPGTRSITGTESTLAQCAADNARLMGKERCCCMVFGSCGPDESQWGMTVQDMVWMLNWLFVRGINLISPHAHFYDLHNLLTMNTRPPDVGMHNYWWSHSNLLTCYTARMCALNTGLSQARVALLTMGDHIPWKTAAGLLQHQIPFIYMEPPEFLAATVEGNELVLGKHRFLAVIHGPMERENRAIYQKLCEIMDAGVAVLMMRQGGRQSTEDMAL